MQKQLNLICYAALLLCTAPLFSQSWQWARKGGTSDDTDNGNDAYEQVRSIVTDSHDNAYILSNVGIQSLNIDGHALPNAATARKEILKITGQDTVCPATVYRFTATRLPGKLLYWEAIGGRIAENNPSDSITVSFDPAKNNYALKVLYRAEGNAQKASDSIYKELPVPSAVFSIEGTAGSANAIAGDYAAFRATTADAMLYSWKITPASAGTILMNGNREVTILWHETTGIQQLQLSVTALICGSAFTSHKDLELFPSTLPEIKKQKGIRPDASFVFTDFPCKDSPVAFRALHPKNGYRYDWEFDGIHNRNPEPCFSFRQPGTQLIKLSVTDENGNTDTSVKYITVVDNTLDGYLVSVPKDEGKSALLQFLANPNSTVPRQYTWMQGSRPVGQSASNGFTVRESGDYWVRVTDENGCMKDIVPPRQVILYKENFKKRPN